MLPETLQIPEGKRIVGFGVFTFHNCLYQRQVRSETIPGRNRPRSAFRAARTHWPGEGGLEGSSVSIFNPTYHPSDPVYGSKRTHYSPLKGPAPAINNDRPVFRLASACRSWSPPRRSRWSRPAASWSRPRGCRRPCRGPLPNPTGGVVHVW